ncbi:hypothetical protein CFC21_093455 [Triticum aestivum]|uniref:DUF3615 domain-containing protein n=2 Tax=Triticum aestivum TaxID=4565 RepID=A0A9R1LKX0_WHEAT|nr:uncharacterized protein LOC123145328 isoform X1 [Triticum aestivum]KAF7090754.1 hypothetical protein CFC21_093455 [Triticum aestivum]
MDPQAGGLNFPSVYVPGDGTRAGHFAPRWTVPDFYANYTPQPPLPGTRAGHFLPRGTAPEFYANYTPQPPPPGCEEKTQHVPGPSYTSSNLRPPSMPTSASYLPSTCMPPWLCPPDFQCPGDLLGRPLTPSLGPPFLHRKQPEWGMDFCIRVDRAGCYHTYPHVGGPFEGLQEAERAIERHLDNRRDPKMFTMDNVSAVDIAVRHYLYLPDGTRKHSGIYDKISDNQRQLVLALVDKYNDDNSLLEDLAYELTKVVCYKSFCEADIRMWYHHINFTAKAKGGVDCKFFAEVIFMQGELPVSCLCMIAPTDDGHCFSCRNNGNDLKHPKDVRYAGGHVMRTFNPFGGHKVPPEACVHDWEAEEARFRKSLEGFDLSGPPPIFPGNVANVYIGPSLWEGGRWRTEAAAKVGAGAEC